MFWVMMSMLYVVQAPKENDGYGLDFLAHRILKNYALNSEPVDEHICYLRTKGRCFNTKTDEAKKKVKLLRLHFMVYWIGLKEKMTKHDNKIVIIILIFWYFIIHISYTAGDINVEVGKYLTTSNWETFVFMFDLKKMGQEWLKLC
jgi:hypothetical protein